MIKDCVPLEVPSSTRREVLHSNWNETSLHMKRSPHSAQRSPDKMQIWGPRPRHYTGEGCHSFIFRYLIFICRLNRLPSDFDTHVFGLIYVKTKQKQNQISHISILNMDTALVSNFSPRSRRWEGVDSRFDPSG